MSQFRSPELRLVLQVIGLATVIAFGIKGIMPQVPIPATDSVAFAAIVLPSLIVALILKFRS